MSVCFCGERALPSRAKSVTVDNMHPILRLHDRDVLSPWIISFCARLGKTFLFCRSLSSSPALRRVWSSWCSVRSALKSFQVWRVLDFLVSIYVCVQRYDGDASVGRRIMLDDDWSYLLRWSWVGVCGSSSCCLRVCGLGVDDLKKRDLGMCDLLILAVEVRGLEGSVD